MDRDVLSEARNAVSEERNAESVNSGHATAGFRTRRPRSGVPARVSARGSLGVQGRWTPETVPKDTESGSVTWVPI
jgi:hypothetical protein